MVLETERVENVLVECIESRNEHQFQYILDDLRINPNTKLKRYNGLSTFEKVLLTPKSQKFIEICICNGCDFYKKNSDGIYPLRFAIDSLCADNLITILKPAEESFTPLCVDQFVATQYSKIINEKLDGGNNYLHLLSSRITEDNYAEIAKMIMALLVNGCNINCSNEKGETPFYLLLKNPIVELDLINFIIVNARIDYWAQGNKDVGEMMRDRGFSYQMHKQRDLVVDVDYMAEHISDWNELQLSDNIELWKENSKDFNDEILVLLEVAIVKNLPVVVGTLMSHGAEINGVSKNSKFKMTPGFLACTFGCHDVLKVLLTDKNLSFQSTNLERNLLQQLFSSETLDTVDRQNTFKLIIADHRCTLDIINQTDPENRVPLFFACKYGCDDIIKELLRRGAYIGYESVLSYIKKDTLQAFLDECVRCSGDITDRDCEVYIDYKFLIPPDRQKSEITPIHLMSSNPSLEEFILHPVIASFVLLKWRKIDFVVYFNLLLYFSFMIFLVVTIVNVYNVSKSSRNFDDFRYDRGYCTNAYNFNNKLFDIPIHEFRFEKNDTLNLEISITMLLYNNLNTTRRFYGNDTLEQKIAKREKLVLAKDFEADEKWKFYFRQHFAEHTVSYWFGLIGLTFLAAYEVIQCAMSFKKYFFKPINWLDISLIAVAFAILIENVDMGRSNFKKCSAIMILLMGGQSIQLFSKVSAFSLSLHMEILNKVCKTFLKTITPYMILISAFGMSFYALNYDEYNGLILRKSNLFEDKLEDGHGFANPFVSTISTVRMMLSDFDDITIKKEDHFQELLFLVFMITISTVLLNLLNALAISDTNQMMEVAEFVELKKRISTVRSYETLYSFFKVTYANLFPDVFTIMLTPTKDNAVKIKRRIQMSDNLTIIMQKTGKVSDFEYFYCNRIFRTILRQPLRFDEKLMTKIVDFVKDRQENQNCESTNQLDCFKDELCAMIRVAQEDMHKEVRVVQGMHEEMSQIFSQISHSTKL
ncbi:transient receptor potential cation channel protein painless-like [Bradysia coprophila]|uniref:transient receptor potential cation channel protein painless-like n=1 Tax=Bradysia coprophila TaxID=38358 RepID=UPI00187DB5BA|nr:transient receptor potential cation channel protein painless-like [Bradysia coprophila]